MNCNFCIYPSINTVYFQSQQKQTAASSVHKDPILFVLYVLHYSCKLYCVSKQTRWKWEASQSLRLCRHHGWVAATQMAAHISTERAPGQNGMEAQGWRSYRELRPLRWPWTFEYNVLVCVCVCQVCQSNRKTNNESKRYGRKSKDFSLHQSPQPGCFFSGARICHRSRVQTSPSPSSAPVPLFVYSAEMNGSTMEVSPSSANKHMHSQRIGVQLQLLPNCSANYCAVIVGNVIGT